MAKDEWMTVAQILEELDVARSTFARWRALGIAPRMIKLPNGELRCLRSGFNDWLRNFEETSDAA